MGVKLEGRRNLVIRELEVANEQKHAEIIKLKQVELADIENKKRSLELLPELMNRVTELSSDLERQLKIISPQGASVTFWDQFTNDNFHPYLLGIRPFAFWLGQQPYIHVENPANRAANTRLTRA